jgi:hypothetical protein
VTNHYSLPMEIFAATGGATHRLGIVHPGTVSQFALPPAMFVTGGSVELLAQPAALGPIFRSGPLLLSAGEVVDLVLAAQLWSSTATIRP